MAEKIRCYLDGGVTGGLPAAAPRARPWKVDVIMLGRMLG